MKPLDRDWAMRMALSWHLFARWLGRDCGELVDECPGCTIEAYEALVRELEAELRGVRA